MLSSGQALSARFVLVRRLGGGGGGEVWLAEDREAGRRVAVKVLAEPLAGNAAAIAAIERESERARSLVHPNILSVDGVYRSSAHVWLAMEYAAGGDLAQLRGRPPIEIVRAVLPVASALAHAHRHGLIHRDVKPANVLLSPDGAPLLADFGIALPTAAFPATDAGRGSLYTISPQQLEGAAASASDDVYGLGAMLYELLSGYPPFYPEATPDRIRTESPAALPAGTPAELTQWVGRMLAKSPDERPDMQTVESGLRAALEALSTQSAMNTQTPSSQPDPIRHDPIRIEPPALRPSVAQGEPLTGQWRRTGASAGGDSEERQRSRRRVLSAAGIAAVMAMLAIVFIALPRWVNDGQPAPRKPNAPAQPAATPKAKPEEIDFAALARAKQEAEELRAVLDERLQKLNARAVDRWGGVDHQAVVAELAAGDEAFGKREYVVAVERFNKMEPLLTALESRAGVVLKEQLTAGTEALIAGRSADAKAAFELASRIEPGNQDAAQGLKRAGVLDEVLALIATADRQEKEGALGPAVATFKKALALDAQAPHAAAGVIRIEARIAEDAFASAMARGYSALAKADHASARAAFEEARKLRPNAPEIGQALRQIAEEQRTGVIGAKLASAQQLETQERWADALKEYRAVVELDSTVAAANEGVARTTPRANLNEQLEMYLTQPERLFSQPVRAAARETLARAQAVQDPGPLLKKQIATVTDWVARADIPVPVALESDNVTHVTIHRVGDLGAFGQRSLELAPGSYTVLGTRPGYRDVRRQINVIPGASPEPIVIRCEDRI